MKHMYALTYKLRGLDLKTNAVLPTGFGKCRIYQAFSLLKSRENTGATLITCIKYHCSIDEYNRRPAGRLALARLSCCGVSFLSQVELEECSLEIILCSVEDVLTNEFARQFKVQSFHLSLASVAWRSSQ